VGEMEGVDGTLAVATQNNLTTEYANSPIALKRIFLERFSYAGTSFDHDSEIPLYDGHRLEEERRRPSRLSRSGSLLYQASWFPPLTSPTCSLTLLSRAVSSRLDAVVACVDAKESLAVERTASPNWLCIAPYQLFCSTVAGTCSSKALFIAVSQDGPLLSSW